MYITRKALSAVIFLCVVQVGLLGALTYLAYSHQTNVTGLETGMSQLEFLSEVRASHRALRGAVFDLIGGDGKGTWEQAYKEFALKTAKTEGIVTSPDIRNLIQKAKEGVDELNVSIESSTGSASPNSKESLLEKIEGLNSLLSAQMSLLEEASSRLGALHEVDISTYPIRFQQLWILAAGGFIGILTIIALIMTLRRNLDEKTRLSKKLEAEARRYQTIVNLSPVGIFVSRGEKIVFVNAQGVRALGGASEEEILGKSILDFIDSGSRPMMRDKFRRLEEYREYVMTLQESIVRLDGSNFRAEAIAAPIEYEGEGAIIVMFRDPGQKREFSQLEAH